MSPLLCVSPLCFLPRRHQEGCTEDNCRGCLRARAADTLRLCLLCTSSLARDALQAAVLHADLGLVLTATGGPAERVSGNGSVGITLNDRARQQRTDIRESMVVIVRCIVRERGIRPPMGYEPAKHHDPCPVWGCPHRGDCPDHAVWDEVWPLASFIARHNEWLAAHKQAATIAVSLRELVTDSWPVAYPSGTKVLDLGRCPAVIGEKERCPGTVKAIIRPRPGPGEPDLPKEILCDQHRAKCENTQCRGCLHRWESPEWRHFEREVKRWEKAA